MSELCKHGNVVGKEHVCLECSKEAWEKACTTKMHQINDDDLETCEAAIEYIYSVVLKFGDVYAVEHFTMLQAAIKRVRDDYGPHTNVRRIEP